MLKSKFFENNRNNLLGVLKTDEPVAIFAHGVMQMSRDTGYRFEQDRNFFYLTGIDLPEWILVMEDGKEYLISPQRSETEEIFDGTQNLEEVKKISGVEEIVDYRVGLKRLQKHKVVSSNIEYPNKFFGVFVNPFASSYALEHKIRTSNISDDILKLRTIKQKEEIDEIKKAIAVTNKGFVAAKEALKEAKNEADIQAAFDELFTREHSEHAYSPIVASGKNACTLHYIRNRDSLQGQGLVLLDIGARSNHYAADVTRTWELEGASERHKAVNTEVKRAFVEIIKAIKPGLHLKDYQKHVDEIMIESLKKLGLEHDEKGLSKYFPHAPSHGLGLDVHDPLVGYEEFQAGMVITLEPGIYIPEEGIGARHEDDLIITKNGVENISENIN